MPDFLEQRAADLDFSTPPTREQVEEAIQRVREHEVDPDRIVTVNGAAMAIRDIPSAVDRALFGLGHDPAIIAQRGWHSHPFSSMHANWPWMPWTCRVASVSTGWLWLNGGQNLVCPGCGIEGT